MINGKSQKARKRLDDRLGLLKPEERFAVPPKGWVRAIREAIGMSGVQFSRRVGVRPQSVEALEKSEASGRIQMNTLRRAAEALDCTLVYALVPNSSLEEMVSSRARKIAMLEFGRVSHTMKLEDQETAQYALEAQVEHYIRNILRERDLWNEP